MFDHNTRKSFLLLPGYVRFLAFFYFSLRKCKGYCSHGRFFKSPHNFPQLCMWERDRTKTAIKTQSEGIFKRHQEEEEKPQGRKREREYCEELLKTSYYVVSFFVNNIFFFFRIYLLRWTFLTSRERGRMNFKAKNEESFPIEKCVSLE